MKIYSKDGKTIVIGTPEQFQALYLQCKAHLAAQYGSWVAETKARVLTLSEALDIHRSVNCD